MCVFVCVCFFRWINASIAGADFYSLHSCSAPFIFLPPQFRIDSFRFINGDTRDVSIQMWSFFFHAELPFAVWTFVFKSKCMRAWNSESEIASESDAHQYTKSMAIKFSACAMCAMSSGSNNNEVKPTRECDRIAIKIKENVTAGTHDTHTHTRRATISIYQFH